MTVNSETSSKRIEANRRNAKRSTGPTSPEGKRRVSLNALKHGLTAATVVLPGEDSLVLQARVDAWKADCPPQSTMEDYLVERAAHVSWQLDRADRVIAACLRDRMNFSAVEQAAEEAEEVADLQRWLYWDPRGPLPLYPHAEGFRPTPRISWPDSVEDPLNPAKIVKQLESTVTGCQWLLERWGDLRRILDRDLNWQGPDRFKAIRMLGSQPMEVLDDDRVLTIYLACNVMDPDSPSSFKDLATEMTPGEADRFKQRVEGRKAPERMPADRATAKAVLLALVDQVVTRLEALLAAHKQRQLQNLPGRLDILAFDDSEEGERMRRYQLAKGRELLSVIRMIYKVRKENAQRGHDATELVENAPMSDLESSPEKTNPMPLTPVEEWTIPADLASWAPADVTVSPTIAAPAARTAAQQTDETNPISAGVAPEAEDRVAPKPSAHEIDKTNPAAAEAVLAARESSNRPTDETNPIPAKLPSATELDPCSEGLRDEPGPDVGLSTTVVGPASKCPVRRNPSQLLPPIIIRTLKELALRRDAPPADASSPPLFDLGAEPDELDEDTVDEPEPDDWVTPPERQTISDELARGILAILDAPRSV
jgi:hypothetical protein